MNKTILLVAVGWIAASGAIRAETPPAKPAPDAPVERLIQQLADDDYRKRDEASRSLQLAGAHALPALHAALNDTNAEVRRRAAELIAGHEAAVLLGPKRVTFKIVNKPIKDAFAELTRQTGYQIEYSVNDAGLLYSFDFQDIPFWDAVEKISRVTGLVIQQGYGDDCIHLNQQNTYTPYVHTEGAFRFTATGFHQYRDIDFSVADKGARQNKPNGSLTLQLSVSVEPKIAMLAVGEVHLEAAYDNDNNCLLAPSVNKDLLNEGLGVGMRSTRGKFGSESPVFSTQTPVNLVRPSEQATTAKVVRGALPILLLVNQKSNVVAEKVMEATGKKTTIGDVDLEITRAIEQPGKQYEIWIGVNKGKRILLTDQAWTNVLFQRIGLQDAKGGKFQLTSRGCATNSGSPGRVELRLTFNAALGANLGVPTKLIYHAWTTEQHFIPFEFKDLPLP